MRSASRSSFERIRASDSRIRTQGVELHMSDTFRALGVSEPVEQALAARGITEPFRIQTLVLPDALEGRDILAKAPTGSGKTLGFGIPLVERTPADGKTPSVARPRPDPRARAPGRRGDRVVRHGEGRQGRPRLRRRSGAGAGEEAQGRAHRRRDAGPPARSRRAQDDLARRRPRPRARRGRPDARHGLQAAGRADHPRACRASARRCSSRRRSTARSASSPASTRRTPRASRRSGTRTTRTASSSTASSR